MIETKFAELYQNLINTIDIYIKNPDSLKLIERAFLVGEKYHDNQFRKNGDPYFTHPIAVTQILADMHAGPETLAAGLLHDTLEDTDLPKAELSQMFGTEIANLVEGVTKISKVEFKTDTTQVEYQQKMLIAMATDIRVVIIKIADRLHNIRTLKFQKPDRQAAIAKETLDIYAPLAHRLGMFRIKAELEDIALKYTDNDAYKYISSLLNNTKDQREKEINQIISATTEVLTQNTDIKFVIKGRIKNIYSIYKKLVILKKDFEDIYDLLAVRIIVPTVADCYSVLGLIHANFTPIPKRFKDYIAMPKPNLYQSLHTTVLFSMGQLFEVQIRTFEMDEVAELGIAAHWAYKENKVYSKEREQFELAEKLKWYADLLKISKDTDEIKKEAAEFVENIKQDILNANVYVFTPDRKVIELPNGSTPIDFAYAIHTQVGTTMVGATINNKMSPIDTKLKTGDIVSIKTAKNAIPSIDWLKIAKSSRARTKIKNFLNAYYRDELIKSGKEELERELVKAKITDFTLDMEFVDKNFEKQSFQTLDDFYFEIGKNLLSPKTVIAKINGTELTKEDALEAQLKKAARGLEATSSTGVIVEGLNKPQVKLALCCNPVYDDEIKGYVSKNSGIVVHLKDCVNLKTLDQNREIQVFWGKSPNRRFAAWLRLKVQNTTTMMSEIVSLINSTSTSIAEFQTAQTNSLTQVYKIKIGVKDAHELNLIILNLKKLSGVFQVERFVK